MVLSLLSTLWVPHALMRPAGQIKRLYWGENNVGEHDNIPNSLRPVMGGNRARAVAFSAFLLLTTSGAAIAQEQFDDEPSKALTDTIVITASKKAETILTSPVAVTAVTESLLQQSGVVGLQDLNSIAPSLHVRNTGSIGAITFSIRGVSNADIFELANPPVVTYLDGVVIGRPEALGSLVHDIGQIEVLRGPQGTLYGRNSTGGNVNILTAKPTQEFDASAQFSYANYHEVQARGMVNVPLSDTLAVRGAVAFRRSAGIYDTMDSTTRDYGAADEFSARVSSLWQPTDNFDWHLILEAYTTHGTPALSIVSGADGKPADGKGPFDPRPVNNVQEPAIDGTNLMVRTRADWRVRDDTTISYIGGYQDVDLRPQTLLAFIPYYRDTPVESTSHEVNVNFDSDRFQTIFGGSYFHQLYRSRAAASLPFLFPPDGLLAFVTAKITTKAWGIFNQSTFDLTENLSVIGGIRYTSEDLAIRDSYQGFCAHSAFPTTEFPLRTLLPRQLELPSLDPSCFTGGAVFGETFGGRKTDKVTWKAGLSYDFNDTTSAYATVSTGFKAAGVNFGGGLTEDTRDYRPEDVINYEVGLKVRAFDRRLSLNTALYYMDYTNIQVTQLLNLGGGNFANVTRNAAGAENYGAELEWTFQASDNGTLSGFFNYVHATYTEYLNAVDDQTLTTHDVSGNFLPFAPEFSAQLRYEHDFPLSNGGSITPKAGIYWQSKSFIRALNFEVDKISSYTKTDLTLSYNDPSGQWRIDAYVNNLENKAVRNGGWVFVGQYMSSYDMPRTYGGRISFTF